MGLGAPGWLPGLPSTLTSLPPLEPFHRVELVVKPQLLDSNTTQRLNRPNTQRLSIDGPSECLFCWAGRGVLQDADGAGKSGEA